jgi:hypothetical protein
MLYVNIIIALYCSFYTTPEIPPAGYNIQPPSWAQGRVGGDATENSEESETSLERVDW